MNMSINREEQKQLDWSEAEDLANSVLYRVTLSDLIEIAAIDEGEVLTSLIYYGYIDPKILNALLT